MRVGISLLYRQPRNVTVTDTLILLTRCLGIFGLKVELWIPRYSCHISCRIYIFFNTSMSCLWILIPIISLNILIVRGRIYGPVIISLALISLLCFCHNSFWFLYCLTSIPCFCCSGMESLGQEGKSHARFWGWRVQAYAVRGGCSDWEAHHFETWRGMERKAGALCCSIQLLQRATGPSKGSPRMTVLFLSSASPNIGISWTWNIVQNNWLTPNFLLQGCFGPALLGLNHMRPTLFVSGA